MTTYYETPPRRLGLSSIRLSPLGLGCWAIGGPTVGDDGRVTGWGDVDDDEFDPGHPAWLRPRGDLLRHRGQLRGRPQ